RTVLSDPVVAPAGGTLLERHLEHRGERGLDGRSTVECVAAAPFEDGFRPIQVGLNPRVELSGNAWVAGPDPGPSLAGRLGQAVEEGRELLVRRRGRHDGNGPDALGM